MDKETLSNYGWIVILVLILSVLLALATPFGNFVAEGFKAAYVGLFSTGENALGIIIPGAEPHEPNTIYYYQPYRAEVDGGVVEFVFHKDGAVDSYLTPPAEYGEPYGEIAPSGTAIYGEGTVEFDGMVFTINEDGTTLTAEDGGTTLTFTLIPTPIHPLYMNTEYGFSYTEDNGDEWKYVIIFQNNGSGTYKGYLNSEEQDRYEIPAESFKYLEEYFTETYYDEYEGKTYTDRHAIYPNGRKIISYNEIYEISCQHENTEIRNKGPEYTGDKYCKDCGILIEKGQYIGTMPGIYQTGAIEIYKTQGADAVEGMLIMSFDELIAEGYLVIENGTVREGYNHPQPTALSLRNVPQQKQATHCGLSGDLFLPAGQGITNIGSFVTCNITGIKIPDGVTTVNECAFLGSDLSSVIIPSSVTRLEAEAFSGTKLRHLTIPDTVKTIGEGLVYACYDLETISFPTGITKIPGYMFRNCDSLTNITIPNTVTEIGPQAFYDCGNLKNITLSSNLKSIGQDAFTDCDSLVNFQIGKTINAISPGAFNRCDSIKFTVESGNTTYVVKSNCLIDKNTKTLIAAGNGFTIPSDGSVTKIGDYVFTAESFTSIAIPSTITHIGKEAFAYSDLTTIEFAGTMAQWKAIVKGEDWNLWSALAYIKCSDGNACFEHSGGTATCLNKALCSQCGEAYGELASCAGGQATCKSKAKCATCGKEYGELGKHIVSDGKCTACNKTMTVVETGSPYKNSQQYMVIGKWDYSGAKSVNIQIFGESQSSTTDFISLVKGTDYISAYSYNTEQTYITKSGSLVKASYPEAADIRFGGSINYTLENVAVTSGSVVFRSDGSRNYYDGLTVIITPNY